MLLREHASGSETASEEDHVRKLSIGAVILGAWLIFAAPAAGVTPPAGPPYPAAVTGQRIYDNAHVFAAETISQAESIILGIEERTGAQVTVYSQVKPESDDLDKANADAEPSWTSGAWGGRVSTTAW